MNWKYYLKCRWWHWLVNLPFGDRLYINIKRLLRKYPHRWSVSDARFCEAERYRDTFASYGRKPISDAVVLEFGAGYDLFITMCLASFGFKRIYSVDRVNWAMADALNFAAENVKKRTAFPEPFSGKFDRSNFRHNLSTFYNIEFLAPTDARNVDIPDASVDYVFANAVLEHIPRDVLIAILKECRRLLPPEGILAFTIDYRDHCRDGKSISPYYFLRFTEKEWKRMYPPDGHNRMRHVDFGELFEELGFDVLHEQAETPFGKGEWTMESPEQLIRELKTMQIAEDFAGYPLEDLAVLGGFWVLRNNNTVKTMEFIETAAATQ